MATTAKATAYLDLNITGFDSAIKTAKNLMAGLAATFAAYKIEKFFEDGIKGAIDFAKEMQSASRAMAGFDPGALLLTQKALEKVGMGAEEARGHIGDFIREGRNVSEIFGGADNYAAALKSAAADYGSQAGVLSRSAEKLQSVWNTMESIGSKLNTFFLTMTEQFVLPLQTALDYLNKIDLAGVGASFGKAIGKAATILMGVFKNGDTINALKSGIEWAFYAGIDVLITGFRKAVAFFGTAMESISSSFKDSFFADDMIIVMKNIFKGLGEILGSAILSAMSKSAKALGFEGTGKDLEQSAGAEMKSSMNHFNSVANIIHDTDFMKAGSDTIGAIKKGSDAAGKVNLGQSEAGLKAKETWETMREMIEKGFQTGTEMNAASREKHAKDEKGAKSVLTSFSGSSSKVIADSLAKVGGGGGFLRAGMSLQERHAMQTAMATKQTAETLKAMQSDAKKKIPRVDTLPR